MQHQIHASHPALPCRRDFIPLCARLLSVAAQGLNENQGLIGFAILANIALAFLIVPLVGLSGLAFSNGQLVPNREPSLAVIMISFRMQANHLGIAAACPMASSIWLCPGFPH